MKSASALSKTTFPLQKLRQIRTEKDRGGVGLVHTGMRSDVAARSVAHRTQQNDTLQSFANRTSQAFKRLCWLIKPDFNNLLLELGVEFQKLK